jgi:hypothetical protein
MSNQIQSEARKPPPSSPFSRISSKHPPFILSLPRLLRRRQARNHRGRVMEAAWACAVDRAAGIADSAKRFFLSFHRPPPPHPAPNPVSAPSHPTPPPSLYSKQGPGQLTTPSSPSSAWGCMSNIHLKCGKGVVFVWVSVKFASLWVTCADARLKSFAFSGENFCYTLSNSRSCGSATSVF